MKKELSLRSQILILSALLASVIYISCFVDSELRDYETAKLGCIAIVILACIIQIHEYKRMRAAQAERCSRQRTYIIGGREVKAEDITGWPETRFKLCLAICIPLVILLLIPLVSDFLYGPPSLAYKL